MRKILSFFTALILNALVLSLVYAQAVIEPKTDAEIKKEQEIMRKCLGSSHWSMVKCIELETQREKEHPTPVQVTREKKSFSKATTDVNPIAATKESIEKGKAIFYQYCYACHDIDGKGKGPGAEYAGRPVADLTSGIVQDKTDGALLWKITEGTEPMPVFGDFLTKEDLWNLINYMRTLPKEDDKK